MSNGSNKTDVSTGAMYSWARAGVFLLAALVALEVVKYVTCGCGF